MGASQSRRGEFSAFARGDARVANSGYMQFVIAGPGGAAAAARDKKKTGEMVISLHFDVVSDNDEGASRNRRALAASKEAIKRHIRSPVLVADMRNRFFGDIRADEIALEYDFIDDVEILRKEDVTVRAHDVRRQQGRGAAANDMTVALVVKYTNTHALTFSETCAVLAGQIRHASAGGGVIQHPDRPSDYELEAVAHRDDLVPVIKKAVFEPVRRRAAKRTHD